MDFWTRRRLPALQTCPWLKKMPQAACRVGSSRSPASDIPMFGDLPLVSGKILFMLD